MQPQAKARPRCGVTQLPCAAALTVPAFPGDGNAAMPYCFKGAPDTLLTGRVKFTKNRKVLIENVPAAAEAAKN